VGRKEVRSMTKLYLFVAEQWVEAESEEEALERLADNAWKLAANAEMYVACPRCLAVIDGWVRQCRCEAAPVW
jgi:hypothetical protein